MLKNELKISCWIVARVNLAFWFIYTFNNGIVTNEGVEIQQHAKNSRQKEGHISMKNPLKIDFCFLICSLSDLLLAKLLLPLLTMYSRSIFSEMCIEFTLLFLTSDETNTENLNLQDLIFT